MTTGVLTTSFPRHAGDYAGCFVEDAVRACAASGETVEVIAAADQAGSDLEGDLLLPRGGQSGASFPSGEDRPDLAPEIRVMRVRLPTLPPGTVTPSLFYGAGAPEALESGGAAAWIQATGFWAGLCERVRERSPAWHRIEAHWLVPSALAARAVAPHLPLTAHAHSGDVALLERIPAGAALARALARHIDDLIFASADLRDRFARLIGGPAGRVARRAPPPERGALRPKRFPRLGDHGAVGEIGPIGPALPTLLAVGRLVPIKGFDILVRAAARAAAQRRLPARALVRMVILGEGPERAPLQALARRLDVDLILPGCVPRPEVACWMTTADLYVQPSRPLGSGRTEGLPTATLEALRAGIPVVASRTGGLGELTGDDLQLVPPADVGALADALAALLGREGAAA